MYVKIGMKLYTYDVVVRRERFSSNVSPVIKIRTYGFIRISANFSKIGIKSTNERLLELKTPTFSEKMCLQNGYLDISLKFITRFLFQIS